MQIGQLERAFGVALLIRSHRGVALTPGGAELASQAKHLIAAMAAIAGQVKRAATS